MNNVQLIGRVTRDIELKQTQNQKQTEDDDDFPF